ncbi:MAG TPA: rhodanese-like domain-containing protein, partial [Longimicrobium sp.]|nr:rhodanese-like domain-containing protein [Longimicrobium sp.]
MRKPLLLLLGLLLLPACLMYVPKRIRPPEVESSLLVSAEQLAGMLGQPTTIVLHVGRDRASYDAGHVPGARWLPISSIVTERDGNPNELPSVEELDRVFESVGVSDNSRVVLYGDASGLLAARAFFTLDYLGHPSVSLLNGGMEAWRTANQQVSTAPVVTSGTFTPRPRPELVVSAEWLREHLNDSTLALVDARPPAEFRGEEPGQGVTRPGHIRGAQNVFWRNLIMSEADPRLRSREVVWAFFDVADVERGDTVVVYCRTGVQASFA